MPQSNLNINRITEAIRFITFPQPGTCKDINVIGRNIFWLKSLFVLCNKNQKQPPEVFCKKRCS